jgi:hypothetical protein
MRPAWLRVCARVHARVQHAPTTAPAACADVLLKRHRHLPTNWKHRRVHGPLGLPSPPPRPSAPPMPACRGNVANKPHACAVQGGLVDFSSLWLKPNEAARLVQTPWPPPLHHTHPTPCPDDGNGRYFVLTNLTLVYYATERDGPDAPTPSARLRPRRTVIVSGVEYSDSDPHGFKVCECVGVCGLRWWWRAAHVHSPASAFPPMQGPVSMSAPSWGQPGAVP